MKLSRIGPKTSSTPETDTRKVVAEAQAQLLQISEIRGDLERVAEQLRSRLPSDGLLGQLDRQIALLGQVTTSLHAYLESLKGVSTLSLHAYAAQIIARTSQQIGKDAHLEFKTEDGLQVGQEVMSALQQACVHLLRNAMDHGLESPEQRVALRKSAHGTIRISMTSKSPTRIQMRIQDDGAGIQGAKLKKTAVARGLMSEQATTLLTEERTTDLIFLDGISTCETITEISGRGLGLSAVKSKIVELGGSIQVRSAPGEGTEFVIELPKLIDATTKAPFAQAG